MNSAITPETILSKQKHIRDYFLQESFKGRIPYGIYRTGVFKMDSLEAPDKKVALDLGQLNYRELNILSLYVFEHCESPARYGGRSDGTLLEYLVNESAKSYPLATDEAHRVETTIIQWLGSNVGQAFLETYLRSIGINANL